jgi:hypothetical protein
MLHRSSLGVATAAVVLATCGFLSTCAHGQDASQKALQPGGAAPVIVAPNRVGGRVAEAVAARRAAQAIVAQNRAEMNYVFLIDGEPIMWAPETVPAVQGGDDDDDVDERPASGQVHIDNAGFDLVFYGKGSNQRTTTDKLALILRKRIADIDRIAGSERIGELTDVQKGKLALAGRGDLQHLADRVDELRRKYQSVYVDDKDFRTKMRVIQDLGREAQELRQVSRDGPFFAGSLFVKTMRRCLGSNETTRLERLSLRTRAGGPQRPVPQPAISILRVQGAE